MCCAEMTTKEIPVLSEVPMVRTESLQAAFAACDWDLLADVIIDQHVLGLDRLSEFGMKRIRSVQDRIRATLEEMCQIETFSYAEPERLLVPKEVFRLDRRTFSIRRRIEACCVELADLEEGTFLYDDPEIDFGFADFRWESVLRMPFWYFSTFCEQERYMMLASAFWEMTRQGFSQDERNEPRGSEIRALDPTEGMLVNASSGLQSNRPAGFDWSYRQRMRSRIFELNRSAEENFFLTLESLGGWYKRLSLQKRSIMADRVYW